jgi:large subunit ribosomal protein L5
MNSNFSDYQRKYKEEILPEVAKKLGIKNPWTTPRLVKIVINVGLKEALTDKKVLENYSAEIAQIAGQKAVITKAKKSISSFKLREGDPIGLMVTLRGKRMLEFFQKLVSIVLPRVRDFRGVSRKSFDQKGNYTLGIREHIVFPEIDVSKIDKVRGLEISIITSAKNQKEAAELLEVLGMPFAK